jgi:hypothetical protein
MTAVQKSIPDGWDWSEEVTLDRVYDVPEKQMIFLVGCAMANTAVGV